MVRFANLDCERQKFLLMNRYAVEILLTVLSKRSTTSKERDIKEINQCCREFAKNLSKEKIKAAILELDILFEQSPEREE